MMQGRIYRFERAQLEDAAAMLPNAPFGADEIRHAAVEIIGKAEAAGALATALIKAGIITTRAPKHHRHWRYMKAAKVEDVKPAHGRKA